MQRFVKRSAVVTAVPWTGSNWHSVLDFCGHGNVTTDGKDVWLVREGATPKHVPVDSWLVKNDEGQVKVVDDDTLAKLYEQLPD